MTAGPIGAIVISAIGESGVGSVAIGKTGRGTTVAITIGTMAV